MRNQKGFSLVELIVAIAIMAIVGGAVVGFCLSGTNSYKNVSNEVDLQYEAQLVMNQLEDLLVDSSKGIGYDSASNTLSIYNNDEAYDVVWNSTDSLVDLNRYAKVGADMVLQSSNLMAEYVKDFTVVIPTEDKNKNQTVNLSMKFQKEDKEILVSKNVTLRNKTSLFTSIDEAYPDASIVNWTITSLDIYKAPVNPDDSEVIAADMTDVARGTAIQFSAVVNGTNNPPQDVTWSLSTSSHIKHSDATTLVNGLLTISNDEPSSELVVTASSNYKPSVTSSIIISLEEKTISFDSIAITRKMTTPSGGADPDADENAELEAIEGETSILAGHYADYTALVSGVGLLGDQETRVIWSLEAPEGKVLTSGTSVSADGRVTVALDETCDTFNLVATSYYDDTCSNSVTLSVIKPAYTTVHIYTDANMSSSVANQTVSDVSLGTSHDLYAYVEGDNLTKEQQAAIIWLVTDKDGNNLATGTTISTAGSVSMTDANTTAANKATLSISSSEVNSEIKVTAKSANSDTVYATVTYKLLIPNYESIAISAGGVKYASGSTLGEIKPGVDTISFSAEITGSNINTAVIWSVLANEGTMIDTSISDSGLLTVGANETASSVKVIAKAAGKTDLTAYVIVPIEQPEPKIILSYNGSDVTNGQFELQREAWDKTVTIYANVINAADNKVTWSPLDKSSSYDNTKYSFTMGSYYYGSNNITVTATKKIGTKTYTASVTIKLTNDITINKFEIKGKDEVTLGTANELYNIEFNQGVSDARRGVRWEIAGAQSAGTTISADGKLTVAADETSNEVTIKAYSTYDVRYSNYKTVQIKKPEITSVAIKYNNKEIEPADKFFQGNIYQFTATVSGNNLNDSHKKVTWIIEETGVNEGTLIDANGRLIIAENEDLDKITIKAISQTDTTKFGRVEIKISPIKYKSVKIKFDGTEVTKNSIDVVQGASIQLDAIVDAEGVQSPNTKVTWSISGNKVVAGAPSTTLSNGRMLFVSPADVGNTIIVKASTPDTAVSKSISIKVIKPTINYYLTDANNAQNNSSINMAGTKTEWFTTYAGRYYFAYTITGPYAEKIDNDILEVISSNIANFEVEYERKTDAKHIACIKSKTSSGTGKVSLRFSVDGYTSEISSISVNIKSGDSVKIISDYTYYVYGISTNYVQYDFYYKIKRNGKYSNKYTVESNPLK